MSYSNNGSLVVEREKINYTKKPAIKKMLSKKRGQTFELPVAKGMQIGMGVDITQGEATSFALIECITTPVNLSEETQHLTCITEENEFKNEMHIIQKAQGSGLGWSVSEGVDYFSSQAGGDTSLVFVDGSTIHLKKDEMTSVNTEKKWKLNPAAEKLLRKSPEKFINQYGTHFIGGFIYGGYFLANISILTKTLEQKSNLKVSMEGAIKGFVASGSASVDFQNSLNSKSAGYSLKASMSSNGAFSKVDISDMKSIKKAMQEFSTQITSSGGEPLIALCYSWETLPSIQDILSDIDKTGSLTVNFNKNALEVISEEIGQLQYLYGTIKSMIANESYIGKAQLNTLKKLKITAERGKQKINDMELSELLELDVEAAEKYIISPDVKASLAPLLRGECNIYFKGFLDGAFDPWNNYNGSLTSITPQNSFKIVRKARHGSNSWEFFIHYYYFNEAGSPDINGKLKLRSIMIENVSTGNQYVRDGALIEPNRELKSHAKWDGADENYLDAWFEE